MSSTISVIGSTGLTGKTFLMSLSTNDFGGVTALTRREIRALGDKPFIRQFICDFSDLERMRPGLRSDVLVCALGTTIKKAGSQEQFFKVDHDLPLEIARIAREEGCERMILISALGANSGSAVFYSRVKGLLEEALMELGFKQLHILRPSILLGDRAEKRPGEFIGKLFMQAIAPLIPWKYRPIHVRHLAATIRRLIAEDQAGTFHWEGKPLFTEI